ncbi:MAG: hypothetical protein Q7V31_11905 [Parvibaculum sp.]|uniref:hypothetical protein n=1 Tax=Parvibaculum sp. TaxID=2024848 RepID=UPI00271D4085|nr:hypothetical protein [Parvibaculum sp.]MDO8839623.1 hypothetical protein [Parvibaculum sp.]
MLAVAATLFSVAVAISIAVYFYSTGPDAAKRAVAEADARFEADRRREEIATIEPLKVQLDAADRHYEFIKNSRASIENDIVDVANNASHLKSDQRELNNVTSHLASRYRGLGVDLGPTSESVEELIGKLHALRLRQLEAGSAALELSIAVRGALAQAQLTAVRNATGSAALARVLRSTDGAAERIGIEIASDPAADAAIQSMRDIAFRRLAIAITGLTIMFLGFLYVLRFHWNPKTA